MSSFSFRLHKNDTKPKLKNSPSAFAILIVLDYIRMIPSQNGAINDNNPTPVLDYIRMIPSQNRLCIIVIFLLVLDYIRMIPSQNPAKMRTSHILVLDYIRMIPSQNTATNYVIDFDSFRLHKNDTKPKLC